jgi:hypothetical protein
VALPFSSGAAFKPHFRHRGEIIVDWHNKTKKIKKIKYLTVHSATFTSILPSVPANKLIEREKEESIITLLFFLKNKLIITTIYHLLYVKHTFFLPSSSKSLSLIKVRTGECMVVFCVVRVCVRNCVIACVCVCVLCIVCCGCYILSNAYHCSQRMAANEWQIVVIIVIAVIQEIWVCTYLLGFQNT